MGVFIGALIGLVFGGMVGFILCAVIVENAENEEDGQ